MKKQYAIFLEMFTYPFPILLRKIGKAARNKIFPSPAEVFEDTRFQTSVLIAEKYLSTKKLDISHIDKNIATLLIQNYKEHRFDLLGSGPVSVNYSSISLGLEGLFYLLDESIEEKIKTHKIEELLPAKFQANSKKLLDLLPGSYYKIDWHRDYKSGFRFDSSKQFNQSFKLLSLGVDLKCPWELTRMQHLPTMAVLAYSQPKERESLILEFKHQIIDLIALNPTGIGVNWACAMDVAIRISNILFAYDLFRDIDDSKILDGDFHQLISNYTYEHGHFLYHHLEYGDGITSNHYLSNIAGLIFIGSYLEPSHQVLDWLYFGIQELEIETQKQFFEEGTNFEGSTSYHRLGTEILLYCSCIIEGMSAERKKLVRNHKPSARAEAPMIKETFFNPTNKNILSDTFYNRLYGAIKFTSDILKPNGEIPQYGDNDSGRFIKIFPIGSIISTANAIIKYENLQGLEDIYHHEFYFDENILNHAHIVSAGNAIFKSEEFAKYVTEFPLDNSLLNILGKNFNSPIKREKTIPVVNSKEIPILPFHKKAQFPSKTIHSLLEEIQVFHYQSFGITIFKSKHLYMSIGYGTNRKSHRSWGHQHNDKLSIEMMIDHQAILLNNGTYLYTPIPELRNTFRSTFHKNVAYVIDEEQNWWKEGKAGLFNLIKQCHSNILVLSSHEIVITLRYREITQIRRILIKKHEVEVYDSCDFPIEQHWNELWNVSNGYGKLFRRSL